jgi:hypothetical protein
MGCTSRKYPANRKERADLWQEKGCWAIWGWPARGAVTYNKLYVAKDHRKRWEKKRGFRGEEMALEMERAAGLDYGILWIQMCDLNFRCFASFVALDIATHWGQPIVTRTIDVLTLQKRTRLSITNTTFDQRKRTIWAVRPKVRATWLQLDDEHKTGRICDDI